jgi:hypothetical protein
MLNREQKILNFLGRTAFILLFFLIISAFSGSSANRNNSISHKEVVYVLNFVPEKASAVNPVQPNVFPNVLVSLTDRMHFRLSENHLKVLAENKRITQLFSSLRKTLQLKEPLRFFSFCHLVFSLDSGDVPLLS